MQNAIVDDDTGDRVDAVYRAESQRLFRALVGYTADRELASDAMAEAFTRALRDQHQIRAMTPWVWRVAFRLAAANLRAVNMLEADFSDQATEEASDLPDLVRALRALPPKQRLAVVLHDYADRPTHEVATVLGSSSATVRVHLSQGRKRLKEMLEERDV